MFNKLIPPYRIFINKNTLTNFRVYLTQTYVYNFNVFKNEIFVERKRKLFSTIAQHFARSDPGEEKLIESLNASPEFLGKENWRFNRIFLLTHSCLPRSHRTTTRRNTLYR